MSIPNLKIAQLVQYDRDNSMYEQQTWMLTIGLLNRNTGCQYCSVRCSSVSEHHLGFSKVVSQVFIYVKALVHINSQLGFSKFHHYGKFCRNRSNRDRDIAIFRIFKMADAAMLDFQNFKLLTIEKGQEGRSASVCQISSKSLELRPRYGDFSIF